MLHFCLKIWFNMNKYGFPVINEPGYNEPPLYRINLFGLKLLVITEFDCSPSRDFLDYNRHSCHIIQFVIEVAFLQTCSW